jgi:UTP--glucose-1-phosphate uridylyltransferase
MDDRRPERAIVPAAGYGTRLRPLTRAIPKEMLPLGRRPVLEYVVQELKEAGIGRILFVVSPAKDMIRAYFGDGSEHGVSCEYALQPRMLGLGDAILRGEEWAGGRPFVVAFGDCIVRSAHAVGSRPLDRMLRTHAAERADATVLTEYVDAEATRKYGILRPASAVAQPADGPFRVASLVEKPSPEAAPSRQAVAARWVLSPDIFPRLRAARPGPNGEIGLTDCVAEWVAQGARLWAEPLLAQESRLDVGGFATYLAAAVQAAFEDEEYGAALLSRYATRQ